MAIFTAIGGAIAAAIGAAAWVGTAIAGGLAFGARYLLGSYLNRQKKRSYTAVQGEVQFGGNVPVGAMFGTGLVKGQRIYYTKWGSGNKFNAEVFALSNGWCDGLEPEVYFYGKRHFLTPVATISNEVARYQVSGFGNKLTIRFYDGRPGQQADGRLVSVTTGLFGSTGSPWKATSTCAGMAYVVVEREFDEELFEQGVPELSFILRGLRLYDPRKDTTVAGGSGAHRIGNPATWQFSQNPALQRLNYQLGLRGLIQTRTLIGEGKSLGQLDLGTYFAAMNVCDQMRGGKPTYQAALYVVSDDDHTEVLKEFDDAMAGYGLNRRGLSGVLVGAPQIPVATITARDIPIERAQQIQLRKSSFDLYNHLSGQFISKEDQWNPASLKPVYVNADIAADGRTRQTSNDFLQVSDPDIAQYLLSIRYRQNRKGGSATVPISRRLGLRVQEGEWIVFEGRTWLIREWQCDESFNITLVLAETGADIYSEAGIEPGPIIIPSTPPFNPSVLSTVQNFAVEVGLIEGAPGFQVPALRFTWTPPDDPTITSVRFRYQVGVVPNAADIYEDSTLDVERGEYITTKDVVSGEYYVAGASITTQPDRFKTWTPWYATIAPTGFLTIYQDIDLEEINDLISDSTEWIREGTRDLIDEMLQVANTAADQELGNYLDRQQLRIELSSGLAETRASYLLAIDVATGPGSALAQRIESLEVAIEEDIATAVDALTTQISTVDGRVTANANSITALSTTVGNVEANVTMRGTAQASPGGGWARWGVEVRTGVGGAWSSAAFFLDTAGSLSRAVFVADQFVIRSPGSEDYPFVFAGGQLRLNMAHIGTVTAGIIRSPDSRFIINLANGSQEWFD
ncbi:phage tail tip fiber protein [Aliihoeflea sp. PC F10.4]